MDNNPISLKDIIAPAFYEAFGTFWTRNIHITICTADVGPRSRLLWA